MLVARETVKEGLGLFSSSAWWPVVSTCNFCPWLLENPSLFIDILCWAPWISQVQSTGLPLIFLRAQPWGYNNYLLRVNKQHLYLLRFLGCSETT